MQIKKLKIGCRTYSVEEIHPEEMNAPGNIGQIGLFSGKIEIGDNHTPSGQAEILLHEVLHALIFDAGLDLKPDREETFVRSLSPRLAAFLADNPAEVRELLKMVK